MCDKCKEWTLLFINNLGFMLGHGGFGINGRYGCSKCPDKIPCSKIRDATEEEIAQAARFSASKGIPFAKNVSYSIITFD